MEPKSIGQIELIEGHKGKDKQDTRMHHSGGLCKNITTYYEISEGLPYKRAQAQEEQSMTKWHMPVPLHYKYTKPKKSS